jgi:serine/threonine protein kinase
MLMSNLDETDDGRVVAAMKEYLRMLDAGDAPTQEDFLSRHAEIADQLRPSLEGLALVRHAAAPKTSATMVPPDAAFTAQPIGDFKIVSELGRGGMGIVYEAIQLSLGRRVALKVLPFASGLDEVRLQRFRNEAHAAAALHHTNIVPVYAVGNDRGVHYYAMQLIEGSTLAELVDNMRAANADSLSADSPKTPNATATGTNRETILRYSTVLNRSVSDRQRYYRSVVRMTHEAAVAIHHAHQYGVIHRDIKPANLLLDPAGKIWVTDFGLAQVQTEASNLTRTGDPMGTLRYMSPEQAAGNRDELDHRTDIYSLGVTLYELLTLQPAINGDGFREMLNNVVMHEPPTPRSIDPALPIELDTIVRKAIAKIPGERYSSAGALSEDLQAWLNDKPIAAKPPTTFELFSKWRRRNSGLVAMATMFLFLATLGLLATTVIVWNEQRRTGDALARETQQRYAAQRSFQQARSAVDTFSNLSETELAYRPELQDLRRSLLETSLTFYEDFLNDRRDDPALAKELEATSLRVAAMVEELRILDSLVPLRTLSDKRVQREIGIDADQAKAITDAVDAFNEQRQSMRNHFVGGLTNQNEEMSSLVGQFNVFMTRRLTPYQTNRLRQIVRQVNLPFTFISREVVGALGLTRQQVEDVNRIIEETRPRRGDGGKDLGRRGPPQFGGPRLPGANGPGFEGPRFDSPGFGGPPPDSFAGDAPRPLDFDRATSAVTENTVAQILKILDDDQRATWYQLIGEPFDPSER